MRHATSKTQFRNQQNSSHRLIGELQVQQRCEALCYLQKKLLDSKIQLVEELLTIHDVLDLLGVIGNDDISKPSLADFVRGIGWDDGAYGRAAPTRGEYMC